MTATALHLLKLAIRCKSVVSFTIKLKPENKLYKSTSALFLLGREALFLTLREEHRLRVINNRALKRIFRPQREVK
jgi:hypothetical protein